MKKGIESLRAAVKVDCNAGEGCFSETGCTKQRYRYEPQENPALVEMGFKTKCVANTKCTHDYCGKYAWTIERAKFYAERTGKTMEEVLEIWEEDRSYWYMNYYQGCKQPMERKGRVADHQMLEMEAEVLKLNGRIEFYRGIERDKSTPASELDDIRRRISDFERERDKKIGLMRMAELNRSFRAKDVFTT